MPTQEYICELGHVAEVRTGYDPNPVIVCPTCNGEAQRQSVYLITPFTESGVKVGRLTETPIDERRVKVSRFKEATAELDYAYKKVENEVGHEIKKPNYFRQGLAKAHDVVAGKATLEERF